MDRLSGHRFIRSSASGLHKGAVVLATWTVVIWELTIIDFKYNSERDGFHSCWQSSVGFLMGNSIDLLTTHQYTLPEQMTLQNTSEWEMPTKRKSQSVYCLPTEGTSHQLYVVSLLQASHWAHHITHLIHFAYEYKETSHICGWSPNSDSVWLMDRRWWLMTGKRSQRNCLAEGKILEQVRLQDIEQW